MLQNFQLAKFSSRIVEFSAIALILAIALYLGFSHPEKYTHPLHGDLVITGNALYNIHNQIPYEVNGDLQWIHERVHYFYVSPLYYAYAALFWNNAKDYTENFVVSTAVCFLLSLLLTYLFVRRFFGKAVALVTLLLMTLTTDWIYYIIRMLYGPWAFLPGVAIILYYLYFKYIESNKLCLMVAAGLAAGLAFYFVPWPVLLVVVPVMGVCVFLVPSPERRLGRRFLGWVVMVAVIALVIGIKEILFSLTGLRYKGDPSGVTCFYNIFFQDRYATMGNFGRHFDGSQISLWFGAIGKGLARFYERVLSFRVNGGLMTPMVLAAFYFGVVRCFRKEGFAGRFVVVNTVATFLLLYLATDAEPRYSLSVYPLAYLIAACFLVRLFEKIRQRRVYITLFFLVVAVGLGINIYSIFYVYMPKTLGSYSTFEANCYNSIEWPLPALKKFLQERKTVYDLIVLPRTLNHHQMHMYLRWYPETIRLDGQSYGRTLIHDDDFRELIKNPDVRAQIPYMKILVVTNNYNDILARSEGCDPSGIRLPYDPYTMTDEEAKQLIPGLQTAGYAGFKEFSQMYVLMEQNGNAVAWPQFDVKRYRSADKLVSSGNPSRDGRSKTTASDSTHAFDGKAATLWQFPVEDKGTASLTYHFDWPTSLTRVELLMPPDAGEAPSGLRLEASHNGKEWEQIGSGEMPPVGPGEVKTVTLQGVAYFHDYRLTFSSKPGQKSIALADVLLLGDQKMNENIGIHK